MCLYQLRGKAVLRTLRRFLHRCSLGGAFSCGNFSTQRTLEAKAKLQRTDELPHTIRDVLKLSDGQTAQVHGWIRSIRHHKNVSFAMIFDGSQDEDIQAVLSPENAKELEVGCSVRISGRLTKSMGKLQQKELLADEVTILGRCPNETYLIQNKEASAEFLRSIPHLRPRTSRHAAILRLRSAIANSMRLILQSNQFTELHAPSIVFSDCEGGGEAFKIDDNGQVFDRIASLSVSAQLYAEIGASSIGRVFTLGPIFRAEKHNTSRHLSEFIMLEVEIPFVDSTSSLMDFAETFIMESVSSIPINYLSLFPELQTRTKILSTKSFTRLTYTEVVEALEKVTTSSKERFEHPLRWGMALQTEHERYLAEKLIGGPVFVYDYPAPVKAFYMKHNGNIDDRHQWEQSTVSCFDLLFPQVAEIIGGSIREDNHDRLCASMGYHNLKTLDYDWYLDLRKYGTVPHGGFGLGFDRLVQYLTATSNIRDVTFIPRFPGQSFC